MNCMVYSYTLAGEAMYRYRTDGLRHGKASGGVEVVHIWDGTEIAGDMAGGAVRATYVRGVGLVASRSGGVYTYHVHDGGGDVVQLADAAGTVTKGYAYDAFGNERTPDQNDANPWRYRGSYGYYWDRESGTHYLKMRQYAPKTGRFTQEDPARAGLNWYTYCSGNPIAFFDPWGLEKIVVSGGYFNNSGDKNKYLFIDSAIAELWKYNGKELATILIADVGLTKNDKDIIAGYFNGYNVQIKYFTDVQELNDYINKGSNNNRADDPITSFKVFSHGYKGSLEFGHGYYADGSLEKAKLSWTIEMINDSQFGINSSAFKKTDSIFYSCNTGTGGATSFAQAWSNITGGNTQAAIGRTTYDSIHTGFVLNPAYIAYQYYRKTWANGYTDIPYMAFRKPTVADGAKWQIFKPQ